MVPLAAGQGLIDVEVEKEVLPLSEVELEVDELLPGLVDDVRGYLRSRIARSWTRFRFELIHTRRGQR